MHVSIAAPSSKSNIAGSVQAQVEWVFEEPDLGKDVPGHGRVCVEYMIFKDPS